jgi:DNA polymerase-3 subunit alpha
MSVLNKKTIESLIKAGGFDSMGHPRKGLLQVFEQIVDHIIARRREHDMGVMTLFGDADGGGSTFDERAPIPAVAFDKKEQLAFEKEMLGLYVSDHPLMGAEASLRRRTDATINELAESEDGAVKLVGGVVTNLQRKWTRKGDLMAVFTLEDLQTSIEVMVFPKTMHEVAHVLTDAVVDSVVCVKGRVDTRDDQPKLVAMHVEVFEPIIDGAPPLRLRVPAHQLSEDLISGLKTLFEKFPGESPVFLHISEQHVLRLPEPWAVEAAGGLMGELRVLLGPDAIVA